MKLKPILARLSCLSNFLEDGFLVILLSSLISLAVTQIILRNFFNSGIEWVEPLLKILVLWVGLAGAMVATRYRQHISINVLSHYLPAKTQLFSALFNAVFTATIAAIISYHGSRFVLMEKQDATIAFAQIPSWWCELIIPLAFGVIAIRFLAQAMQHAHQIFLGFSRQ